MSSESSRKRGGDKMDNEPADKLQAVSEPTKNSDNIVLVVGNKKFFCSKKKLAEHSEYFKNMFFGNFPEKDKEEVKLVMVAPEVFQLFIDAMDKINKINDTNVEAALFAAVFLQSSTLERMCLEYLGKNSDYNSHEQLQLAEKTQSKNLAIQVFSTIQYVSEMHELLPTHLGTLSNFANQFALQRMFELNGYRLPPRPPVNPEERFEQRIDEILDQIEVQNLHGNILTDQLELLDQDVIFENAHIHKFNSIAQGSIDSDQKIKELVEQWQSAHDALDRNYFGAQILVEKWKHFYTAVSNSAPDKNSALTMFRRNLECSSYVIERNKRNRVGPRELASGNRPIDNHYRNFVADRIQPPRTLQKNSRWIQEIENHNNDKRSFSDNATDTNIPADVRQILPEANFTSIDTRIRNIRKYYYNYMHHIRLRAELQNGGQNYNNQMENR